MADEGSELGNKDTEAPSGLDPPQPDSTFPGQAPDEAPVAAAEGVGDPEAEAAGSHSNMRQKESLNAGSSSVPSEALHSAAPPPRRGSRFFAHAATALVGGLLGVGGSYSLRYLAPVPAPLSGESEDRSAPLSARLDAVQNKLDAVQNKSEAFSRDISDLKAGLSNAESAANKAAERANAAESGLEEVQKNSASHPEEPAAAATAAEMPDLGPLNSRLNRDEQKLASLEAALAQPKAEFRAEPQEREAPAARQEARAQAIATVAQGLLLEAEAGRPFSQEVAALEHLGVPAESLAPLRATDAETLPSEHELAKQFAALAPAVIASDKAKQPNAEENFLDRVTRHAKDLVHIRREGEDADVEGVVEHISRELADHDLEAAYKLWTQLPDTAIAASQSWGEVAKKRLDAISAARSIETDALSVLGTTKQ
ncbi:MAG TPA: hypothetical protein VEK34_01580 [Methylocella sp.]|nr:hypothetical protein [Methylocella sp.]